MTIIKIFNLIRSNPMGFNIKNEHMKPFILLIILTSAFYSCNQGNESSGKDIILPVSVIEIKPGSMKKFVSVTGTVKPRKEAQIKSEISGVYSLLRNPSTGKLFSLNDQVKAGQEIIALQDVEYENNVRVSSLKLNLETTKQLWEKQKSLFEKGGVTQSDVKASEINYINAKYSYDDAMFRLEKMRVRAPFAGTIVDLPYYTPGVKIQAASPMVTIMDYSVMYMDVNLAEKNMGVVKPNQPVWVTNYALPGDTLLGAVTQLSPAIDANTRAFKGTVEISNPEFKLRPGMYIKAEIEVASAKGSIVIPKEVIVSKYGQYTIFVVENGLAIERDIKIGLENTEEVQVLSGLKANDRLVVKGFETLSDEAKVKVVKN